MYLSCICDYSGCIRFWDVLNAAVWYKTSGNNSKSIPSDYIILFLSLHTAEAPAKSPIVSSYDSMWPGSQPMENQVPSSPLRNYINDNMCQSPSNSPNSDVQRMHSGPKSPRSPSGGLSGGTTVSPRPTSPKRAGMSHSPKPSNALHLHSIRSRLPSILRALACRSHPDQPSSPGSLTIQSQVFPNHMMISKEDVDCLGLLIGGGLHLHRDEDNANLSSIFSQWRTGSDSKVTSDKIACNDALEWLEANLCTNDSVYPSNGMANEIALLAPQTNVNMMVDAPQSPVSQSSSASTLHTLNNMSPASPVTPVSTHSHNIMISSKVISHSGPIRIIYPLSYISPLRPTNICGATSVVVHVMATNCGRYRSRSVGSANHSNAYANAIKNAVANFHSSSFQDSLTAAVRSTSDLSIAEGEEVSEKADGKHDNEKEPSRSWITSSFLAEQGASMDITHKEGLSRTNSSMSEIPHGNTDVKMEEFVQKALTKPPSATLPNLVMQSCHRTSIYVLSPYAAGHISNCCDVEGVIGPIAGVLIISDCERLKISVLARKIIIRNCLDCVISCGTLTPIIVAGDSRGLLIGPYNTAYKDLSMHVELARLTPLLHPHYRRNYHAEEKEPIGHCSSNDSIDGGSIFTNSIDFEEDGLSNAKDMWKCLWDVSQCVDSSHAHEADAAKRTENITMPTPTEVIASLLPVEKYRFVAIPEQSQCLTIEDCPIDIAGTYISQVTASKVMAGAISSRVLTEMNIPPPPLTPTASPPQAKANSDRSENGEAVDAGSNLLSEKFMVRCPYTVLLMCVLLLLCINSFRNGY